MITKTTAYKISTGEIFDNAEDAIIHETKIIIENAVREFATLKIPEYESVFKELFIDIIPDRFNDLENMVIGIKSDIAIMERNIKGD